MMNVCCKQSIYFAQMIETPNVFIFLYVGWCFDTGERGVGRGLASFCFHPYTFIGT